MLSPSLPYKRIGLSNNVSLTVFMNFTKIALLTKSTIEKENCICFLYAHQRRYPPFVTSSHRGVSIILWRQPTWGYSLSWRHPIEGVSPTHATYPPVCPPVPPGWWALTSRFLEFFLVAILNNLGYLRVICHPIYYSNDLSKKKCWKNLETASFRP